MSEEETISCFQEGDNLFASTGYSDIKVTRDGEVITRRIPIKSTGVIELLENLSEEAPIPPTTNELVEPESELGRRMKLKKKQWVRLVDASDPIYQKKMDEYNQRLGYEIILQGLAIDLKDKDGGIITDKKEKLRILKSIGFTATQFEQLANDIQKLTSWSQEERADFFEGF